MQESKLWTTVSLLHSSGNAKKKGASLHTGIGLGMVPLGEFTLAPGMGFRGPCQVGYLTMPHLLCGGMTRTCDALVMKDT